MSTFSGIQRLLWVAILLAALYSGIIFLGRYASDQRYNRTRANSSPPAPFDSVYASSDLKIVQFYARDANVTEGAQSVICYGVVNAKSVRIEPPVDGVQVSPNRCVEVAPEHDTKYTLTAEGADGRTVSESFVLPVKADSAILPAVTAFRIENHKPDYRGREVFLLSFAVQNAVTVEIDPPAFPTLHGAPSGRFYVAPVKTTTYTLTVTGAHGHKARRDLTVPVPPN
ncbi:MAG TPA: hypothetical protein VKU19_39465 [Bryobacteraceae bacterium]|nr:hypothetical protein [Bryobacteraceae bacterium]